MQQVQNLNNCFTSFTEDQIAELLIGLKNSTCASCQNYVICIDEDHSQNCKFCIAKESSDSDDDSYSSEISIKPHKVQTFKKRKHKSSSYTNEKPQPQNRWQKSESDELKELVMKYGEKKWTLISSVLKSKTAAQCSQHWRRVLVPNVTKGSWTEAEQKKLFELVDIYGFSWKEISRQLATRTDTACRYQYLKAYDNKQHCDDYK